MIASDALLEDNPFFGIDCLSQEMARNRGEVGFERVADIMEYVGGRGMTRFAASTHPRLGRLVSHLKEAGLLKMDLCSIFPYAQGYVGRVTEKGAADDLFEFVLDPSVDPTNAWLGKYI